MPPITSIVMLCYNKLEVTKQCLEALYSNTPSNLFELLVVDNASTDGTLDFLTGLSKEKDQLQVIHNSTNLGFVGGNNSALEQTRGKYVIFLNNDTEPQPGWLEALLRVVEAQPQVGAVGSKLVYPDGRLQEAGGVIFSDATGLNWGKGAHPLHPEYNYLREVDYCSGASLLVRGEILRDLGGFDKRYSPAYYEDTDLCFAVRAAGYRVMYQPESVVIHHEGATAGTNINAGFKRYQEINRPKFIQKWKVALDSQPRPTQDVKQQVQAANRATRSEILFAHIHPPLFDRASGALRLFNLMRILVLQGHRVTFLCKFGITFDGIDLTPYIHALQQIGVQVYPMDIPIQAKIDFPARKDPIGVVIGALKTHDFTAAILPFYYSARDFIPLIRLHSPQTRILIDSVDVHFLREARKVLEEGAPGPLAAFQSKKQEEIAVYRSADGVITVTDQDRITLQKHLPDRPITWVPDPHQVIRNQPGYADRKHIMFLAGFKHTPNLDAVWFFYQHIWPKVSEHLPDVQWWIVGDSPPVEIQALANQRIIVTGFIPDLEPILSSIRVNLAPLRFGAGMKGKIALTLGRGIPCITTQIGAEGMGLRNQENCLIADSPEDFADAVISLYGDAKLWEKLSIGGQAIIEQNFGDSSVYSKLQPLVDSNVTVESCPDCNDQVFVAESLSTGFQNLELRDYSRAKKIFLDVLALDPNQTAASIGLAFTYLLCGETQKSKNSLQTAQRQSRHPEIIAAVQAKIYELQHQTDQARSHYLLAINSGTNHPWCLSESARFFREQGELALAAELFSRLAEITPSDLSLLLMLSAVYAELNDPGRQSEIIYKALRLAQQSEAADVEKLIQEIIHRYGLEQPAADLANSHSSPLARQDTPTASPELVLQTILAEEDLMKALERHSGDFSTGLVSLICENARSAQTEGEIELAEGLFELSQYIENQMIARESTPANP